VRIVLAGPDPETSGLSAYTLEDLAGICEQRFGKRMHPWSLGRLLKRLGLSRQKTSPIPPYYIPWPPQRPLKEPPALLRKLQHTHKNKRLRLFFQDEARIVPEGTNVATCGGSAASDRPAFADKRFTFAYIFAAVEPGTDNAFALIMPYVNTEAMQEFLDRFAKTIRDDEHVAMVLDQAGCHGSNALRVPDNITLLPLPPYSPELNPIERVMALSQGALPLAPPACPTYDAVADAASKAWNRLRAEVGRLTSLCSYPWIPKVKRYEVR